MSPSILVVCPLGCERVEVNWFIFHVLFSGTIFCLLVGPGVKFEAILIDNLGVGTGWVDVVMVLILVMVSFVMLLLVRRSYLTQAWVAKCYLWYSVGKFLVSLSFSHIQLSIQLIIVELSLISKSFPAKFTTNGNPGLLIIFGESFQNIWLLRCLRNFFWLQCILNVFQLLKSFPVGFQSNLATHDDRVIVLKILMISITAFGGSGEKRVSESNFVLILLNLRSQIWISQSVVSRFLSEFSSSISHFLLECLLIFLSINFLISWLICNTLFVALWSSFLVVGWQSHAS